MLHLKAQHRHIDKEYFVCLKILIREEHVNSVGTLLEICSSADYDFMGLRFGVGHVWCWGSVYVLIRGKVNR